MNRPHVYDTLMNSGETGFYFVHNYSQGLETGTLHT